MTILGEREEFDKKTTLPFMRSIKNVLRSIPNEASLHELESWNSQKKGIFKSSERSLSFGLDADLGKQDEKIMFLIPFFFWKDLNELARDWADEKKLVFDAEIFLSSKHSGPYETDRLGAALDILKRRSFLRRGLTGRFSGRREIEQVFEVKWDRKHLLHPHRLNL